MMLRKKENKKQSAPQQRVAMRRRSFVLVAVIFLCFALLAAHLFYIQVMNQDFWQQKAVAQQLSDVQISANRGQIYDANMTVLAQTREVCTIVMAPKNILQEKTRVKIADELSEMLGADRETLYAQTQKSTSQYEVVKSKVDKSVGDTFINWVNDNGLAGVFRVVTDYKREYPLGSMLSTVMGFVGTDNVAREGLERKYDETLSGIPGRMVIAQNTSGDKLPTSLDYEYTVNAEDGNSLVLTVDQYIQQVTEKYLAAAIEEFQATNRGCAIVMEADTGAILAMATKGDYDPNNYLAIGDPATAEKIALLSGDEQAEALRTARLIQYRNKALDFYEPGSVFKTVTASIGLEEGLVNENSPFYCNGAYHIADRTMSCWYAGHGQQTFRQAIANSCNPAFMTLGGTIGASLFCKYYIGFGFTTRTGVDLLGEQTPSSALYYTADTMSPVDVAASSIGQTFKVTPLQMATALCAIANGGKLMQPYIVQKVLDSEGNVISHTQPTVKRQVISEQTSRRVCDMLEEAVSGGAIGNAYIAGYRIGGKTGTSEKTETKSEEDKDKNVEVIASFGGIAPAENPQVVVLVMVDEPQTIKSGARVAAPVARNILRDILPYLGVEPNYTEEELANLDHTVPQVTGKQLSVAATALKSASLTYETVGSGDKVVRQIPESGTTIPKDGVVWLYTDDSALNTTKVPDFAGKSLSQVNQTAKSAGINVVISGINTSGGVAKAVKQSVAAGDSVPKGSVVTVEFSYSDNIF